MQRSFEKVNKEKHQAIAAPLLLVNVTANGIASKCLAQKIFDARTKANKDKNPSTVTYIGSERVSTDPKDCLIQSRFYAESEAVETT